PTEKLFARAAIVNADYPSAAKYMASRTGVRPITYGVGTSADIKAGEVHAAKTGIQFDVRIFRKEKVAVEAPLFGRFNASNCLAEIGVAISQGLDAKPTAATLASFPGIPGRMERIDCGQPFEVFVDIASTPAALENVLTALRGSTEGRLWVVFG